MKKTGSEAGIIVANKFGNYGYAHNPKAMPIAVISGNLSKMISHACQE